MRQLKIQKSITNRTSEALDKYLVEIGHAPLISIDEEIELAQKIKKGGPDGEKTKYTAPTNNTEKISGGSVVFVVDDNAPGPGSYAPNMYENQTNREFENPYKK